MKWSEKLKLMRAMRGMQQLELAHETNIWQSKISVLENGLCDPTPDEKQRIEEVLGWDEESICRMANLRAKVSLG